MNTASALDPNLGGNPDPVGDPDTAGNPDTGGDLVAAIALLAQTLVAQNGPPPPAPYAPIAPVTMPTRLREPDTFDGSDASKLRVFILQCNLHFQDHANAFTSDRAKVAYALSYLTGPSLGRFEPGLFALTPPAWVHHWDLFHAELESNFGPFDPVGDAKTEIENLVMTKGSRSATYFVEFNHLASRIQWDDHALLRQAYKGLACHIKNEMVHHDWPVTLQDLRKLVQTINHRYWEWKAEVMREANPTSRVDPRNDPKTGKNPKATPKGKSLENPKPGPDLVGKLKLTPQERQRCMDNSLCLFCRKTGHIAKECPKSTAIAARARAAVTVLQESFVKEAKKD